jgi:hypothetical protein
LGKHGPPRPSSLVGPSSGGPSSHEDPIFTFSWTIFI